MPFSPSFGRAIGAMVADTAIANELMPGGWSEFDPIAFNAFFGVVDDATTYVI